MLVLTLLQCENLGSNDCLPAPNSPSWNRLSWLIQVIPFIQKSNSISEKIWSIWFKSLVMQLFRINTSCINFGWYLNVFLQFFPYKCTSPPWLQAVCQIKSFLPAWQKPTNCRLLRHCFAWVCHKNMLALTYVFDLFNFAISHRRCTWHRSLFIFMLLLFHYFTNFHCTNGLKRYSYRNTKIWFGSKTRSQVNGKCMETYK